MERPKIADGVDEELLSAARGRPAAAGARLTLTLEVTDPEVAAELRRHPAGEERDRYAQAALRLGVLSLRTASGQLDAAAIREAGQKLVADVRELLSGRATELTEALATSLKQYFDPQHGVVPARLQALVQKDGELERALKAHVGPEESLLARTLAAHLGRESPLAKLLSPTDAASLKNQVAQTLEEALARQRDQVLRQFSLDHKDSALSRLVAEIEARQGNLGQTLEKRVEALVKELSLDAEQSALSRLSRLLTRSLAELGKANVDFQAEVRAQLAALAAQRQEAARSTRHGSTFEAALGELLLGEAQRQGDGHEACGASPGAIKNCKVGDHVIELGPESPAPGARVVWEAKEDRSYDLRRALGELDTARKNRKAQLGVFVMSRRTAPEAMAPLSRHGHDLIVVWDAEDPASDVAVKAAYSVARALAIREAASEEQTAEAALELERSARAVEKQLQWCDEVRRMADTVAGHGLKMVERMNKVRAELAAEVERLDRQAAALRTDKTTESNR